MRESQRKAAVYGRALRAHLDDEGIAVRELARRIGDGDPNPVRANLYRYLSGKNMPSETTRARIAKALGVRPEELYVEELEGVV